ncbi:MAG: hypothetical protein JKY54_09235 [Flavobacteriales bacterium]|nr:hypothetical protein [Flavobacteriales bacterium]
MSVPIYFTILLTFFTLQFNAQLLVEPVLGYSFGITPLPGLQAITTTNQNTSASTHRRTYLPIRLGEGLTSGLAFSLPLKNDVSLEVSGIYQFPTIFTQLWSDEITTDTSVILKTNVQSRSFSGIRTSLMLKLSKEQKKFSYGINAGLCFLVGGRFIDEKERLEIETMFGTSTSLEDTKTIRAYSGRIGVGATGSLDIEYKLNSRLSLPLHFGITTLSWSPARSVLTLSQSMGQDLLPSLSVADLETHYLSNYTTTTLTPTNIPSSSPIYKLPISSITISLGLRIRIGKVKATTDD